MYKSRKDYNKYYEAYVERLDGEIDIILENFADAVVENKKAHVKVDQDPFEFYVDRVQSGIFSEKDLFALRFIKGYHVLVNELSKDS